MDSCNWGFNEKEVALVSSQARGWRQQRLLSKQTTLGGMSLQEYTQPRNNPFCTTMAGQLCTKWASSHRVKLSIGHWQPNLVSIKPKKLSPLTLKSCHQNRNAGRLLAHSAAPWKELRSRSYCPPTLATTKLQVIRDCRFYHLNAWRFLLSRWTDQKLKHTCKINIHLLPQVSGLILLCQGGKCQNAPKNC